MNVLFICRGKANGKISPITERQLNSLKGLVNITVFPISGKGWTAYIKNVFSLRKFLLSHPVDIIHAHYSYSGIVASLASRKSAVCSLMGSDIEDSRINRLLIRIFAKFFWKETVVKSKRLKEKLGMSRTIVIPNGISLEFFKPASKIIAREKIGFDPNKKIALFLADPSRQEKNYTLAQKAIDILPDNDSIELKAIYNIDLSMVPDYISASDMVILTSKFEGSPNVIKEAMACNCPIVSTDVGDVREVIGNTEGCFITSFEPEGVAEKIQLAIEFNKKTNGRDNITHLDEKVIAQRLIDVYQSAIAK